MPDLILRSVPSDANRNDIRLYSANVATGTLAATESQDTASFAGKLGHTGALSATEAQDSASFVGKHGQTGTLAATEAQDVAAFSGTASTSGSITGTLSATESQDTASFTGSVGDSVIGRKYPRGRSRPRTYEEEIQIVKEEIREEVL